jgi:hypothetical protein
MRRNEKYKRSKEEIERIGRNGEGIGDIRIGIRNGKE